MSGSNRVGIGLRIGIAALASAAVWAGRPEPVGDTEVLVVPFVLNEARELRTIDAQMLVYNPDGAGEPVSLRRLRVRTGGDVLFERSLVGELPGDPRFGHLNALIERLPHEVTEIVRERRYFASPDAAEFEGDELVRRQRELAAGTEQLRAEYAAGRARSFRRIGFPLALDQLFFSDAAPGSRAAVTFEIEYETAGGAVRTASAVEWITRLAPFLVPPTSLGAEIGVTVHAGDLHVHTCHGEALGACAPSTNCIAETPQLTGSFTIAELRSQFEALGCDWFTATDHSYCINDEAEYQAIAAECAAATDASFVCMPDTEVSSDEVGPQEGTDIADAVCLFTTSANHMGAHGLTSRVHGGEDGLLGFCNGLTGDVLNPFTDNVAAVHAMGGYSIANHPSAGMFGWNSIDALVGLEQQGLHGIEIWNGNASAGQGGSVAFWVDRLLEGHLLYAYAGSDTHDEAHAFGANHAVLVGQEFTSENLKQALMGGRVYLSDNHAAMIEVDIGGLILAMGTVQTLPAAAPPAPLTVRVGYDFGGDTSTLTIFKGRVGDGAETVLCQSGPLTGSGFFECADTLETGVGSWYRAYSAGSGGYVQTNPVFFRPGGEDPLTYCTAKPNSLGCVPAIAFAGEPSVTDPAPFLVTASAVLNQQFGLFFYGYAPALTPFQDGTLCVSPPIERTVIQHSGGAGAPPDCTGTYGLDFNARIQGGADPGLTAGTTVYGQYWSRDPQSASTTGLSDALQFTIRP
ncbi:MAG: hypothetical protein QF903_10380 [Planctomycetota bacterium]|jgi:hypothetical protein|nr:hypothetical protein [Planctomycetota bacterium]MDP6763142.1 hypothetical protein [Planctomycetota bacterium]MDP6989874.1 hypothetical protein [Planctomycetota bacterium]